MAHQSGRGLEQILDGHEPVVSQGAAGGHKINNRLRHAGDRAEFDRTVQMHQFHRQIKGIEEGPGAMGELAGDAAVGGQVSGTGVTAAGLDGHRHAAAAKSEIHELGDWKLMLLQNVVPHHTKLGLAVGHVGGHITIAHQQSAGPAAGGGQHQLAVVLIKNS